MCFYFLGALFKGLLLRLQQIVQRGEGVAHLLPLGQKLIQNGGIGNNRYAPTGQASIDSMWITRSLCCHILCNKPLVTAIYRGIPVQRR